MDLQEPVKTELTLKGRLPRFALLVVVALLTCAALAGLHHLWWVAVERRFQVIDEGKVYQSGELPPDELPAVLGAHGIRTVVDLRKHEEGVDDERRALAALEGVRYVHLPAKQVPDAATVAAYLQVLDDPESYPLLVHCEHGYGRSSVFTAIYRMERLGWDNDRARRATRLLPELSSFGREESKGRYLLAYRPGRRRDAVEGTTSPAVREP